MIEGYNRILLGYNGIIFLGLVSGDWLVNCLTGMDELKTVVRGWMDGW